MQSVNGKKHTSVRGLVIPTVGLFVFYGLLVHAFSVFCIWLQLVVIIDLIKRLDCAVFPVRLFTNVIVLQVMNKSNFFISVERELHNSQPKNQRQLFIPVQPLEIQSIHSLIMAKRLVLIWNFCKAV